MDKHFRIKYDRNMEKYYIQVKVTIPTFFGFLCRQAWIAKRDLNCDILYFRSKNAANTFMTYYFEKPKWLDKV